jgi:hypothetical protein
MAEPERHVNQSEELPKEVYDEPTGTAPSDPRPDLTRLEKGEEPDKPSSDSADIEQQAPSRERLSQAEEHENAVGRGYRSAPVTRGGTFKKWTQLSGRKKWGIGLGAGVLGGGFIAFFLLLLPALRLEGYMATINRRVFAAGANAVEQRVENQYERYLMKRILFIERCGNRVTGDCAADYTNMGIAGSLFNSWRDAKIEYKFFDKFGLEVQSYKNHLTGEQRYKIIDKKGMIGNPGDQLTIKDGKLVLGKYEGGSRIFGKEWAKFIGDQTRWYQFMQRKSVRKYLVRKHGVRFWCFFACKTSDSVELKAVDAKTRYKYQFVKRFVLPFSPKYAFFMNCLISGDSTNKDGPCGEEALRKQGIDRSELSDDEIKKIIANFENNPSPALSRIVIQGILEKILVDEAAAKTAVSAIPVAGQIYFALVLIDMFNQLDQFVKHDGLSKFAADLNSRQYLEYYAGMRSANDEMKAGVLPPDEVGTLMNQFNDGNQSAEESLVYQAYRDPSKATTSLLGAKAYAATAEKEPYLCANGKPIPQGELVCPEKKIAHTFAIEQIRNDDTVSGLVDALNIYQSCHGRETLNRCIPPFGVRPSAIVHPILKRINDITSAIFDTLLSKTILLIGKAPGVGSLISFLDNKASDLAMAMFQKVFPLPVQLNSPGREKYDGLEAGGEVAASEFNKGGYTDSGQPYGLGGRLLSPEEQANASQAYLNQEDYNSAHSSVIARLGNMENPNSVLNRFIAIIPTSWGQLSANASVLFSNPFRNIGLIWHPAYAADTTVDINAFGVPRFGYEANDPVFKADPAIYTPEYCQTQQKQWEASKSDDPVTGIDQYSKTNPCLLEQVSVEAASSVFTEDDSLSD